MLIIKNRIQFKEHEKETIKMWLYYDNDNQSNLKLYFISNAWLISFII